MPAPLTALVGAVIVAAGGFGVGSVVVGSGGSSPPEAARAPALGADPTGPPDHMQFTYQPPGTAQQDLPGIPSVGAAPAGGAAPQAGPSYVPNGQPQATLGRLPTTKTPSKAQTWPLYLSGGDQLQPDVSAAVTTNQTVGAGLGGPCSPGTAGRWTAPPPSAAPLHGSLPGVLQVAASGSATLTISFTSSTLGGSCSVLSSAIASASGTGPVPFTLPRIDVDLPSGVNISLVVSSSSSVTITSHPGALSYIVAPTPEQ